MLLTIYGDEAAINKLVRAAGITDEKLLLSADLVREEDMLNLEKVSLYTMTTGIAIHRSLVNGKAN